MMRFIFNYLSDLIDLIHLHRFRKGNFYLKL